MHSVGRHGAPIRVVLQCKIEQSSSKILMRGLGSACCGHFATLTLQQVLFRVHIEGGGACCDGSSREQTARRHNALSILRFARCWRPSLIRNLGSRFRSQRVHNFESSSNRKHRKEYNKQAPALGSALLLPWLVGLVCLCDALFSLVLPFLCDDSATWRPGFCPDFGTLR